MVKGLNKIALIIKLLRNLSRKSVTVVNKKISPR